MTITNPFVTSGYLSPHYFCDRVEETNVLTTALTNDFSSLWCRRSDGHPVKHKKK